VTVTDIPALEAAARSAGAALAAAKDAEAATAKVAAEKRQARSVAWAIRCITTYPQRQAEANERVTALLAGFDETVETHYADAPSLYLAIARAMAAANGVGVEYARARSILRQAGILAPEVPGHREDPIGYINAPFPPNTALPPFAELVASSLDRARLAAFRAAPPASDPAAFTEKVFADERQSVIASEWILSQEMEALLGLRVQHPDRFERNIPAAQKAATEAYAAGRAARGYDAPFPKMEGDLRQVKIGATGDSARITLTR